MSNRAVVRNLTWGAPICVCSDSTTKRSTSRFWKATAVPGCWPTTEWLSLRCLLAREWLLPSKPKGATNLQSDAAQQCHLKVSWGFVGVGDEKDSKPFKNKMPCWPPAVNAGAFITAVPAGRFFAPSFFCSCSCCASSPQSSTNASSLLAIASAHTTEKVIWYTSHRNNTVDNTVDNAVARPQPSPPALASQQCKNNNTVQWLVPVITLVATTYNDIVRGCRSNAAAAGLTFRCHGRPKPLPLAGLRPS